MKKTLILGLLICLAISACATTERIKLEKKTLKVGDFERTYYIHYPKNESSQSRLPLLIVLHGGGRKNGDETARLTGFDHLSNKENFIAVFPNGFDGKWHDGRLPDRKQAEYLEKQENDITFINHLIDYMIADEKVDADRIYMTGLSNGGMMAMRMACESSEKLAAVATIIANMPTDVVAKCEPASPLSFAMLNGTDDPLIPWEGGEVKALFKDRGTVISTEKTFNFWLANNQCELNSRNVTTLPNINSKDESEIDEIHYHCSYGNEMILFRVRGGGHTLPGSNIKDMPRLLGNKNRDANGAQLVWDFLKRQKRSQIP